MIVDCSLKLESIAFINIICSNFQEQCNKQFEQLVDKLLGYCSIQLGMKSADKKTEKEFSCATKKKQILFYDGINPINTKNLIEMLKKHLTANCFYSFQQEFERVYHTYFQNLLPPCSIVANGSVKLLFGNRTIEKATDRYQGANNKFMTCGEITSYFYERVQDQFHIDKEHIVIIISSPWDLMDRFHENIIEEEPNPTNFDPKGTEGEFFRENLVAYRKPVHDSLSNTIRGKHEIIHGEYLSRDYQYHTLNVDDATTSKKSKLAQDINNRKALNASFDTNFYLLLTLLFRWLRSGPDSKDGEMLNRQITIISTDWENGINFAIDSKVLNDQNVLTINHHCLKATRLEVIDSVDENIQVGNVDTTDGSAKRRGSRTITYSNRENDKLLDKLNNSLPGGMVLRNCKSSGNRAVDICDDPSSPLVSPLKFIEIEGDKNIEKDRMTGRKKDYCNSMMGQQLGLELKLPSLRILSGPTILEVGSDSVLIGLQIIGIGVARCLLFELPTNVNENDALSLLYMEREHLQLVGEVRKRNMSRSNFRDHLVRFHKLRSYCAYLAVVEPTQSATPMVAYCRTQLSSNSEVSAVILGSVGSPEYAQITPRLMKIRSIAQTYRSPSSSVYLLDITADNWLSSCKTRNMLINPIRELLRGGNVYHTEPHKFQNLFTMKPKLNLDRDTLKVEHDNMKNCFHDHITSFGKESTIHINMNGQFCYLSSTDSSVESIVELIDFILKLDYYPQVRSLIIFLSKPLVHHIRRRQYFADYVMEGPLHQAKDICKKFLLLLLDWKAKSKYYDCKIISLAAVSELKVFEIRNKSIDRINYPPLKKEQTPREHESLINNIGNQKSADIGESLMSSNDGITNMKRKLAVKFTENKDQEVLKKVNPTGYYRNKEGMLVKIEREIPKLTTITLQGAAKIADKNSKDNAGYESDAYAADGKLVGLPNSTLLDQINDEIEPALQKSEHRQRQGTTTQNILDNLMNIKESDPKELLSDVINEVNSSTEVDSLDDFIDCKIMQVLLPLYKFGTSKEENSDDILTFKGINFIDDAITYELLENVNADDHGVEIIMPLDEIYEKSITYNKKEPLVYRVEVIMKSIFDGAEMDTLGSAVQSLADSQASSTITIVKPDQNQTLYIRAIVEEIDLLDILMGPLIGLVTTNTAFISFEVNMSLESVTCVLQPRWSPGTSSTKSATLTDVKGHQVFQFKFENLTPNMIYTIYLPDICPDKVLGNFQTLPVVSSYLQVAFVGNDLFPEVPLINELLQQINHQQFPNFLQISLVNKLYRKQSIVNPPTKKRKNRSKLLSLDKMYDNGDNVSVDSATLSEHSIMSRDGNAWDWLSHHLTSKATPTIATFHLGSWSLLVKYFDVLFDAICEKAINLRLPFDKSTAIGQYYYKQFDELIKDTFRYVFNIPMVKEALALGVHLPLFHSDYLLPTNFFDIHHEEALLDSVPRENTEEVDAEQHSNSLQRSKISQQQDQVESDENKRAAVRKILKNSFEVSMKEYVIGMYGLEAASPVMSNGATESNASNEEAKKHRSQIWRASSLAVASLDIVSGRKKLKKNENEEEGEKMTNSKSFHLGFLDRTQWKLLKSIANDKSVTHIIIATESPIIPLTAIASDYHPPDVVEKGNFLPWSPTIHDLSIFMNFWIDWLRLGVTKNGPCGRNITLMSTSSIPYGTTVQDLRTGLKINQFCVSNFNIWSDITPDAIDTISSRQGINFISSPCSLF